MIEERNISKIDVNTCPLEYGEDLWGNFYDSLKNISIKGKFATQFKEGEDKSFLELTQSWIPFLEKVTDFGFSLIIIVFSLEYMSITRVNTFKKLWKKISETENWLNENTILNEKVYYSADKQRFAGMCHINHESLGAVEKFVRRYKSSFMVLLNEKMIYDANNLLDEINSIGFSSALNNVQHIPNYPKIIELICLQGGGLFRSFGNEDYGGAHIDFYFKTGGELENLVI